MRRVRARQHVNPDGPYWQQLEVAPLELVAGRPVELEIGCADAQFLFERAAAEPDRHYVGLEIREKVVRWVNAKASETGLPVRAVLCHVGHHLEVLLPPASVDRVYLNFPDPWFKRRYQDRRMIDPALAGAVARVVRPGGDVLIQSDVWPIALDAMAAFDDRADEFTNCAGPWSFWRGANGFGARSWREANCEAEGLEFWRLRYRRAAAPAHASGTIAR